MKDTIFKAIEINLIISKPVLPLGVELVPHDTHRHIIKTLDVADTPGMRVVSPH